jgi:hypothetical protein
MNVQRDRGEKTRGRRGGKNYWDIFALGRKAVEFRGEGGRGGGAAAAANTPHQEDPPRKSKQFHLLKP